MIEEMTDSMSTMVLVGLSQSEWEYIMQYFANNYAAEDIPEMKIIIQKLINQIY